MSPDATSQAIFRDGRTPTTDDLFPVVYDQCRRLARRRLSDASRPQSLSATGLVHEAYLRLGGGSDAVRWASPEHFFAAAGEAMRRILIDRYRKRLARKRGGGAAHVVLDERDAPQQDAFEKLVQIDEILDQFASAYPRQAMVFKLRCFAGMTTGEVAESLQLSRRTATMDWSFSRAWLSERIGESLA